MRRTLTFLALVLASMAVMAATRPAAPPLALTPAPAYRDLAYGPAPEQRVDVYRGKANQPLVLFFHGTGGDKAQPNLQPILTQTLARGWWFVSANYREGTTADTLAVAELDSSLYEDGKAAMRFVRGEAKRWRYDSTRVAAWGSSRGATVVLWLVTTCRDPNAFGRGGYRECPRAVVNQSGATYLVSLNAELAARGCTNQHRYPPDTSRLAFGSALTHVSPATRPITTTQGVLDCTVPVDQARSLDSAMIAHGRWVRTRYYATAGHVDPVFKSDSVVQGLLQDLVSMFREP